MGADFAANIAANTTSDDPGRSVAEVKAETKRVMRMGKIGLEGRIENTDVGRYHR